MPFEVGIFLGSIKLWTRSVVFRILFATLVCILCVNVFKFREMLGEDVRLDSVVVGAVILVWIEFRLSPDVGTPITFGCDTQFDCTIA